MTVYCVLRVLKGGGFSLHCVFAVREKAERYCVEQGGSCRFRVEAFGVQE